VGETMSGEARIVVVPTDGRAASHLIGNAAAYGATGGRLYVAGRAGQRFGVRNSGATLVCEGVGKYAFEYMTGGVGVVLGHCGPCIGSGMTGGELYLYDPEGESRSLVHADLIIEDGLSVDRCESLKAVLGDYLEDTQSLAAAALFARWFDAVSSFIRVTSWKSCD